MKKKIFDRRGAGIELAILMMVVSFSMAILLTGVALIQSTKKVRAEERLQQSIALEQLGQDFLNALQKGDVENWTQNLNNKNNHTGHTEQATAHNWVEKIEPATCKDAGKKKIVCSSCNEIKSEETISALGHDCNKIEPIIEKNLETGEEIVKGQICTDCQTEITEDALIVHKWEEWSVVSNATCTGEGIKTRSCDNCSKTDEQAIPALGHNCSKIEPIIEKNLETGEEIVKGQICTDCQTEITENALIVHKWIETEEKKATCTETGVMTFTCENCESTKPNEDILCIDHTWGDDNKCTVCGEAKPFEGKWDDAYALIVYKNGDSFDVYVTITASEAEVCEGAGSGEENIEVTEPAGKQVLAIRVEKVTDADGNFTYKIMEWTKNDRS